MERDITVLKPGIWVMIADGDIRARLVSVSIGTDNVVTYECLWWDGRNRQKAWLEPMEIEPVDDLPAASLRIGFHNGQAD